MNAQEIVDRCSTAAVEFDRHERRDGGLRVIANLCGGLTRIRDSFFDRVHCDVEMRVGKDSMIQPISEEKTERTTKLEIEVYQVVVSAGTAESRGYVSDGAWFRDWLARLRLGSIEADSRAARRLAYYAGKSAEEQRMAFSNILAAALPEALRAPLILLKLLPLAVEVATALAFGKSVDAMKWRHEQIEILPAIADCHHCHGALLDNGEQCEMCGNPLWTFEWLTIADG
jgi:hypothetical protein